MKTPAVGRRKILEKLFLRKNLKLKCLGCNMVDKQGCVSLPCFKEYGDRTCFNGSDMIGCGIGYGS